MYIILTTACCSHSLTHNTSGDSMKVASSSDRVTSMFAPTASESAYQSLINHQSTGQSIPAAGSRWLSTRGQNKAPAKHRFPRARALSHTTIVSRCPVCLNTKFKIKSRLTLKKRFKTTPANGHTYGGVISVSLAREQTVNVMAKGTTLDPNFAGQLCALPRIQHSNRKAAKPP